MSNFIKQKTKTLVINNWTNYILAAFIFIVAFSYIYFANMAVRTLTVLEKTKQQMQSVSILVSELESKRLTMENGINIEKVLSMGFIEVNNPIFIVKSTSKVSLSFKTD